MNAPLLLIDAGHSRTKMARSTLDAAGELPCLEQVIAVPTDASLPWQQIEGWFQPDAPPIAYLAGSNLHSVERIRREWRLATAPARLLSGNSQIPVALQVEQPARVGVDRLLNALAANRLRTKGEAVVIVDTGTAITVDAVTSTGAFRGGAILPGVRMGALSLHHYTSSLPELDSSQLFAEAPSAIGRFTEAAIASGLYWGHVGAVRELIFRMRDELASVDALKDAPPITVITGGAAELLRPHFSLARFEPHLALQGLALTARHLEANAAGHPSNL